MINMMKWIFFLVMINSGSGAEQDALKNIRDLYQLAADQPEAAEKLMHMTGEAKEDQPVTLGYKGAAHMMMAKHVVNPFSKMSHFNKGKKIFSRAIERSPRNLELRFLRFAVQSEAPGFLGYRESLEEDKRMLVSGAHEIQDPQAQKMIIRYLLGSDFLSADEKKEIKQKSQ